MKHLPVPALSDTLDRYLAAVEPLLDLDELEAARCAVAEFAAGVGPLCQAELERFADQERGAGRSWLSEAWLEGYLSVRAPLPLSTSFGFLLAWPTATTGLALAAEVVHGFACTHLAFLRGEAEPEVTSRGEPVDSSQWQVVAGGLRHPRPGVDEIRTGPGDAANREIGVLWRGRWLAVPISDRAGAALPRATVQAALARVVELAPADRDVTAISYLGGDQTAACVDRLLADPENRCTYDRIADALFAVHLDDSALDPQGTRAREADYLRRVSFEPGRAWTYKPLTYQVHLDHPLVALHMEHSVADGGTLQALIAQAHRAAAVDPQPSPPAGQTPAIAELSWRIPPDLAGEIERGLADYRDRLAPLHVQIVRTANPAPAGVRISLDAVQQWVMLFAQLATFGRVRSTYESVDMREYAAGRTECLRPNTPQAVALTRALVAGTATPDHVGGALDAHRDWVKAAKAGHGVDRHLLGLRLAAERLDAVSPLHRSEAYRRLTTDFLSTTSMGGRDQIVRCTFSPTSRGGFGFYYAARGASWSSRWVTARTRPSRPTSWCASCTSASSG